MIETSIPSADPVNPDSPPAFYGRSCYEQFLAFQGGQSDEEPARLLTFGTPHISYGAFAQWCADLGLQPEYWPGLWKDCDRSDGVQDNRLGIADDLQLFTEQCGTIASALDHTLDLDGNGMVDPREYAKLTEQSACAPIHLEQDHQASAYVVTDRNGDGRISSPDQDLWDENWALTHNGVSFYSEPGNATIRAQAIAKEVVAQNKLFNLFGEMHLIHPWQEITQTVQGLRSAGKAVIYTVELDPEGDLKAAADLVKQLEADPAQLTEPAAFQAAVTTLAELIDRTERKDLAYSIVSALRVGARVAFIDTTTQPESSAPRSRDDLMAERLLALRALHPDTVFVCQFGAYHASQHDLPAEAIGTGNNLDCRPVARRLLDAAPNEVFSMNYMYADYISQNRVTNERVYNLSFMVPWNGGLNQPDSWSVEGWNIPRME